MRAGCLGVGGADPESVDGSEAAFFWSEGFVGG